MKLIDTTVAVDHLRGLSSATRLLTELVAADETLAASEITRFELLAGVRREELDALEDFFSALVWIPVDEEISRTAGALTRRLRRSHRGIDDADYLIGATALVLEADLLTTNVRHFPMIPDLCPPYRAAAYTPTRSGTRKTRPSGVASTSTSSPSRIPPERT